MSRPKIGKKPVCVRINLTISPEVYKMLDTVRIERGISISNLLENTVRSEYKKIMKSKEVDENSSTS